MSRLRISIKHTELGYVDIDADKDSPIDNMDEIEDLARAAFDNGDAVIVASTLDIVGDKQKPEATYSKVPKVVK